MAELQDLIENAIGRTIADSGYHAPLSVRHHAAEAVMALVQGGPVATAASALRAEADRLDAERKFRKWGLLDPGHQLTDDGSIGRFVALEPDQLRFAALLAERLVGTVHKTEGAQK